MPRLLRDFEQIPLDLTPRPRVAVVGEILLTYHEDANKHIVSQIRQEGGEPLLPDLTNFMLYCLMDSIYDWRAQGGGALAALGSALAIRRVEKLRRGPRGLLAGSPLANKLMPVAHIDGLAHLGEQALSLGNAAGEGWLLPAEMLEFMHHGVNNVLCLQPFGCLPNHVVGRGSFKTVRPLHENATSWPLTRPRQQRGQPTQPHPPVHGHGQRTPGSGRRTASRGPCRNACRCAAPLPDGPPSSRPPHPLGRHIPPAAAGGPVAGLKTFLFRRCLLFFVFFVGQLSLRLARFSA
jgi:hypothetical protein